MIRTDGSPTVAHYRAFVTQPHEERSIMSVIAEKVEHTFRGKGRTADSYPWDTWLDGSTWRIWISDLAIKPESFRTSLYLAAKRRGLKGRVNIQDGKVIFQAYRAVEGV
jgi:hypothetical protein